MDLSSTSASDFSKRKQTPPDSVALDSTPITPTPDDPPIDPNLLPSADPHLVNPAQRIQILDLHTSNPVIAYQGQVFSCEWASTIGTDLLFTSPDTSSTLPKLRQGEGYDLLSTSSIKIVGNPVELVLRPDDPVVPVKDNGAEAEGQTQIEKVDEASQAMRIDVSSEVTKSRKDQARFLERLMAAKTAKGETDQVPIHSRKRYAAAEKRAQEAEVEADAAEEAQFDEENLIEQDSDREVTARKPGMVRAPRGRRRRQSYAGKPRGRRPGPKARSLGGLFRDYGAEEAIDRADTRLFSTSTPSTWHNLSQTTAAPARAETPDDPTSDVLMDDA